MSNIDKAGMTSFESLGLTKPKAGPRQASLGQEDFMKLMTTQMNNQDPMKPMENGDFLTQMAQFSAVSGLKDIKDNFKTLTDALQSNQALQASSLVGKSVLVPGETAAMLDRGDLTGAVEIPVSTSNLNIMVHNSSGELIKTINMGSQQQGMVNFKWDGMHKVTGKNGEGIVEEHVPAGKYLIRAEMDVNGEPQSARTYVIDKVDSVSLGSQGKGMTLNLANSGSSTLNDIKQIM